MKKYEFESAQGKHQARCKNMKEAIKYKDENLCPFQNWIIREVTHVQVKMKYSKIKKELVR